MAPLQVVLTPLQPRQVQHREVGEIPEPRRDGAGEQVVRQVESLQSAEAGPPRRYGTGEPRRASSPSSGGSGPDRLVKATATCMRVWRVRKLEGARRRVRDACACGSVLRDCGRTGAKAGRVTDASTQEQPVSMTGIGNAQKVGL